MVEEIKLTKRLQRVFDYMIEFGSITAKEAFEDLGETQLPGAIHELKKKGVHIGCDSMEVLNRYKEKRIVTRYWVA